MNTGTKTRMNLASGRKTLTVDKSIIQPGEMAATIEWFVTDQNGIVTQHQPPKKSESYVQQFIQCLYAMAIGQPLTQPILLVDTAGVTYGARAQYSLLTATGLINIATRSIVVGSGNTAPTITDFQLQTQIAHGVGAGQLQYSATTFAAPAADATTAQFTITRNFANGSGGAVVVNEIGLYVLGKVSGAGAGPTDRFFMIIRDVIGGGISIPNGQTLTVNYRPQVVA